MKAKGITMKAIITSSIVMLATVLYCSTIFAEESKQPVNVDNFVRAESDQMIRANMKAFDVAFGKFSHLRKPFNA